MPTIKPTRKSVFFALAALCVLWGAVNAARLSMSPADVQSLNPQDLWNIAVTALPWLLSVASAAVAAWPATDTKKATMKAALNLIEKKIAGHKFVGCELKIYLDDGDVEPLSIGNTSGKPVPPKPTV